MDADRCLDVVRTESGRLADAGRRFPAAQVVGCPGWDVQDLVGHLGAAQAWVTAKLHGDESLGVHRGGWSPPPPDDGDWGAWLDGITALLVEALATVAADTTFESWAGVQPVAFWQRRMAQEAAVHRWDGESATGPAADPVPVDVATDGIDELLAWFLPLLLDRRKLAGLDGWTMHLAPDDAAPVWRVEVEPTGVSVGEGGGGADVAVRGSASDLLLWLWNRPTEGGLAFDGDEELATQWRHVLHV